MPRACASKKQSFKVDFQVKKNLDCKNCNTHIIKDGKLTCPRCHEHINMISSHDIVCDEQSRWQCQKCLEHGKNPKTLAIGDKIKCRRCEALNDLLRRDEMSEEKTTITSECRDALWLLGNLNLLQVMDNPLCGYVWKAIHHVEKCKNPICISAQTAVDTLVAILMWCDSTQEAENQRFIEEVLPKLFKKDKIKPE